MRTRTIDRNDIATYSTDEILKMKLDSSYKVVPAKRIDRIGNNWNGFHIIHIPTKLSFFCVEE